MTIIQIRREGSSAPENITEGRPLPVSMEGTTKPLAPVEWLLPVKPVITAGAYTSGDALGGRLEFVNASRSKGLGGIIESVVLLDHGKANNAVDIYFWGRQFAATADNAAFDPSKQDYEHQRGSVNLGTFKDTNTRSTATATGVGLLYQCEDRTLYAQLCVRGTTAYTATDDLTVIVGVVMA
jgi:hypothetical protein